MVRELFKHYSRDEVYEEEFNEYFKKKGLTDEEIDVLWLMVLGKSGLVKLGLHVEAAGPPPKRLLEKPSSR